MFEARRRKGALRGDKTNSQKGEKEGEREGGNGAKKKPGNSWTIRRGR